VATTQQAVAADEDIVDILNFALLLEYLDSTFYELGLEVGVIPAGFHRQIFMQLSKNENRQVAFLQKTIRDLGGTPIPKPDFDYTAKGAFRPFENYGQYLLLSQAFEDTGVRAYKGQAPNLMGNEAILTAALRIHSVEARHAARVRRLRGVQSWYLRTDRDKGIEAVYKGEGQLTQGGVNLSTVTQVSELDIMEAFDEPLTKEEVLAIASLFLA
jgi:rubrerythrin